MENLRDHISFILKLIPLIVLFAAIYVFIRNRRERNLKTLTMSMGLTFNPKGPDIHILESTGIKLFNRGVSKYTSNLINWNIFGDICAQIFDYSHKPVIGYFSKYSCRHYITVMLINLQKPLPQFVLRPEYFSDKLAEFFGFNDIDFNAYPEFSKKYFLKGKNRDEVMAFFSPEILMFFARHPGWSVEVSEGFFACWKGERYLNAEDYPTFMEEVKEMASVLLRK
jgi:hypothetical protein